MPTPGTVGRPGQEFRPIRQREPETWSNQGTGQVLSLTSCDFPPCDATLPGTCSPGLLVTRACCSRPPSLRGRWWTLWTVLSPEMVSALVLPPIPGGAGSYDPMRREAAWAGSPQVPGRSRPDSPPSAAVGPGVQSRPRVRVPVSRPESGCGTDGGRTVTSAGCRAGGWRWRGACCNRDKSEMSGVPASPIRQKRAFCSVEGG